MNNTKLQVWYSSKAATYQTFAGKTVEATVSATDRAGNLYAVLDGPAGLVAWDCNPEHDPIPCDLLPTERPETDGHQSATLVELKRGEYVRLKINGPVWIRGPYCRENKTFELHSFDDANRVLCRKGSTLVYHGFTF